ncbi:hypothetical protein [Natrinema salaciae]|uniref:Uncharacterized protein n=1 Tax=Natrinema salaciae TaxID=1186196 RepID=A0A1H9K7X0_9EURY|nr:hypothetical protein [Natrinema salaciae]SEQ95027.1 hypothetical protein SAMN04489841_2827 [Natrinema salaciae]
MMVTIVVGYVFLSVVALPVLVYFDARRLEIDDPGKWIGIVLLTGGTGVLLYLFERTDAKHGSGSDEADPFGLPGSSPPDRAASDRDIDDSK